MRSDFLKYSEKTEKNSINCLIFANNTPSESKKTRGIYQICSDYRLGFVQTYKIKQKMENVLKFQKLVDII